MLVGHLHPLLSTTEPGRDRAFCLVKVFGKLDPLGLLLRQHKHVVDRQLETVTRKDNLGCAVFVTRHVVSCHEVYVAVLILGNVLPEVVDARPGCVLLLEQSADQLLLGNQFRPAEDWLIAVSVVKLKRYEQLVE